MSKFLCISAVYIVLVIGLFICDSAIASSLYDTVWTLTSTTTSPPNSGDVVSSGGKYYRLTKGSTSCCTSQVYAGFSNGAWRCALGYRGQNAGKITWYSFVEIASVNLFVDSDGDGLDDDYDPCPDSEDKHIDITKTYNACTGEWYKFTVNGDSCDTGITYRNTKYSFADLEDAMDAAKDAGCLVTAFSTSSMSAEEYQRWWEQEKNKAGASGPPAGRVDDTDSEVDGPVDFEWDSSSNSTSSSSNSTSDSSGSTSSNSSESSSGSASSNSTSASGDSGGDSSGFGDDLKDSTDKVVDSIEKLGDDIDIDLKDQTRDLKLALAGTTSAINAGSSRLSGDLGDVWSKLSGLGTTLNGVSTGIGNAATQAHTDAQAISDAVKSLAKAVNGSGDVVELSMNGTGFEPPKSTDIEGVVSDRVSAAKSRFSNSWSGLQTSFNSIFTITLSGSSDLPKWTWNILGQTVVIDFNDYATELNWIAIAGVLFASISAIFIVFDK